MATAIIAYEEALKYVSKVINQHYPKHPLCLKVKRPAKRLAACVGFADAALPFRQSTPSLGGYAALRLNSPDPKRA
jgi:hypothetical protein